MSLHPSPAPRLLTDLLNVLPSDIELIGTPSLRIEALMHPAKATLPTHMIYSPNESGLQALVPNGPRAALVSAETVIPEEMLASGQYTFLVAQRPRLVLGLLLQLFETPVWVNEGIHPTAVIDPTADVALTAQVGPFAVISPNCVVGEGTIIHAHTFLGYGVQVGSDCILHAGAKVMDRCVLGDGVILQPNCVVGSDGFSFITPEASKHEKTEAPVALLKDQTLVRIPSVGNVVLGNRVEVGACTTIDRGTLAETKVGNDTKFDNLVQVGHNNTIGDACLIVSQVGIAGSCTIGNGVVMAGQVGLADHLTIGDGAILMAKSGVMNDIPAGDTVVGAPAYSKRKAFQIMMSQEKLPQVLNDYKKLKKRFEQLESQAAELQQVLASFNALQREEVASTPTEEA